jgi:hypothetical protein
MAETLSREDEEVTLTPDGEPSAPNRARAQGCRKDRAKVLTPHNRGSCAIQQYQPRAAAFVSFLHVDGVQPTADRGARACIQGRT